MGFEEFLAKKKLLSLLFLRRGGLLEIPLIGYTSVLGSAFGPVRFG